MTMIDQRLGIVAALGVTFLVTSCETLPHTELKPNAGKAGQTTSSGGMNAGGNGGMATGGSSGKGGSSMAGTSSAGAGMGGSAGTAGNDGAGKGGTSGANAGKGGSGNAGSGDGGDAPVAGAPSGGDDGGGGRTFSTNPDTFFGESRCAAANVAFCEDFESGSLDGDRWTVRGSAPDIDDTRAARGMYSAHFHTEDNGLQYISQSETFPAPNNTYFVRMFVWFDTMPTEPDWAHWTVSGALEDGNEYEIRVGGQYDPGADKNLFGVGTDHGPTGDWTNLDQDDGAQPVPTKSWVCLEWMHKGDTNEGKFWWDGVEHPSLATSSTNHGGSDDPYVYPSFDEMWVGWWLYQEGTNPDHFDVWIDEVAVDYARIGCDL